MAPYLSGRVLNAGCGDRDITALLKTWHADTVDNCDIRSSIPGALACDLTAIPRPDGSYDSILCNAVLEHVPDPERVVGEFRRLLVPAGRLVISVPFLQPFHPTPFDFRRYTREGIEQLAARSGFTVIELRPVHSLAQTLGWLVWAHLEHSSSTLGSLGRSLCWLPIFLATKMFQTARPGRADTANSFQAVMVKN